MDLVTFLRARLDEREAAARQFTAALAGPIPSSAPFALAVGMRVSDVIAQRYNLMGQYQMDPAHVLADVASKRLLLDYLDKLDDYANEGNHWAMPDTNEARKVLAAPFVSHPDFDPAWAAQ